MFVCIVLMFNKKKNETGFDEMFTSTANRLLLTVSNLILITKALSQNPFRQPTIFWASHDFSGVAVFSY